MHLYTGFGLSIGGAAINELKRALILGLFTGLFGVGVSLVPLIDRLEIEWGLGVLFTLRGPRNAPGEVVVILIDQRSFQHFGVESKSSLWPREHHARLVDSLHQSGARVIVFDLIFDEPRNNAQDVLFADAIKRAGNVILFQYLKREFAISSGMEDVALDIERLISPIPQLAQSAAALAPFPLPKAPSAITRIWTFKRGAGDVPTLPAVALQVYAMPFHDTFLSLIDQVSVREDFVPPVGVDSNATRLGRWFRSLLLSDENLKTKLMAGLSELADDEAKSVIKALLELYSGQHSRFLDFYGPPKTVTTILYHEIMGNQQRFDFNGKAVFIGFSEQLDPKDGFYTVYTDPNGFGMSGVEIVATSFANLLEQRKVESLPYGVNLLIIFSWGLGIGLTLMWLPRYYSLVTAGALIGAFTLFASIWFAQDGTWIPMVVPLLFQMPVALLGTLVWHFYLTRQEHTIIREAFRFYLPDEVIEELIRDGGDSITQGQLVNGICLATDAAQYTSISERLSPESLRTHLNRYYQILFRPVKCHGGFVSDVVGDSMLAIWASASADPKQRYKACQAALEILRDTDGFNSGSPELRLPTRIGLHSGEIMLGNVGADDHFEYRAVGDIVNGATRIEALNKHLGTRLLASQAVVKSLPMIKTRELGHFRLLGKTAPLTIHELIPDEDYLKARHLELYERFTVALQIFQEGQWAEACLRFREILKHYQDGPALFYFRLAKKYGDEPPPKPWDGVVVLSRK